ncbi:TEA/ATTS domain family-domain-containing protein [Mycena filopes]|nr:TEA/ATTS domain family-domain-containing protein [Mycena filopes]
MPHAFFHDPSGQAIYPNPVQSVIGSRRCWKKLHGEDVWPVHLEAALIEALQKYVPDDSRETKVLGRYRGRNQFISQYIFCQTGEYRTNKQVGSRLQQMRHCTRDPKIRDLLNPARSTSWCHLDRHQPVEFSGSSDAPYAVLRSDFQINIPILPRTSSAPHSHSSPRPLFNQNSININDQPRHLGAITPATTFLSPHPVAAHSWSAVLWEGQIIHAESVPLTMVLEEPALAAGFLHRTHLVPSYWHRIVNSLDPTAFTILQEVVNDNDSTISFSAQYRFVCAEGSQARTGGLPPRGMVTGIDIAS